MTSTTTKKIISGQEYNALSFQDKTRFWKENPLNGDINFDIGPGITLHCQNDDTVAKELYWGSFMKDNKEKILGWERESLTRWLSECKQKQYTHVFDVGSYTGIYSILAAKTLPSAKVYAFEIIESIKQRLDKNIQLNNCSGNIRTYHMGVSSNNSSMSIREGSFENGLSSVSSLIPSVTDRDTKISVMSLDNIIQGLQLPVTSRLLVKIDTEGHEQEVIKGMSKTLRSYCQVDILTEILESSKLPQQIKQLIDANKPGYSYTQLDSRNYFFSSNI